MSSFGEILACKDRFYNFVQSNCTDECGHCINGAHCDKQNGTCANGCTNHFQSPVCQGKLHLVLIL